MAAGEGVAADGRYMMDAQEVAAALGVKIGFAYKLIRGWNEELKAAGKLIISDQERRLKQ